MTQIMRRPVRSQPNSFEATPKEVTQTQKFNKNLRYVQGFRFQLPQGATSQTIRLNSSGKELLGISIIPVTAADQSDTQISFIVNNNNLLIDTDAENLNPNFVQGMIFFPTPQPLFGNDTIQLNFTKNNVGTINVIVNIFYVPRV